jgi:hypothetical protein
VDLVVPRAELHTTIAALLRYLRPAPARAAARQAQGRAAKALAAPPTSEATGA